MLKRLLFAVRSFGVDPWPQLGSWKLSIVLMVVAALYYGFLTIWAASTPPATVQNIAGLTPFWIVYTLLLINTAVCLWRRLPALRKEISRELTKGGRAPDWSVETPAGLNTERATQVIKGLGYRPMIRSKTVVEGVRRRWTGLGTYLFHGAFFLLAIGFMLTLLARQEATVWVSEGESFEGIGGQFLSHSAPRLLASGLPPILFRVEEIHPEFWGDQLLFTRLEADLEFPGDDRKTTKINRPLWLGWRTFVRLSGFGYTPRYELLDRSGFVLDSAFIKLNVFPPGQRDSFNLPNYPHRVYLSILPDAEWTETEASNRTLNLANPAIELQVARGKLTLGTRTVKLNEVLEIEGLSLRFPEIRYWGEFSIVSDPGAPILFLGYLFGLAGLLFKLFGPRQELRWTGDGGSAGTLSGWGGRKPGGREIDPPRES